MEDDDVIHFSLVSGYNGPLFYPGGCTMYNPRRILRQLCCVQNVPQVERFNFKVKKVGTKNTEMNFTPKYDPAPSVDHRNNIGDYIVTVEYLEDSYYEPNAADPGYMEWYEHIYHPRVINSVQQARADKAKVTTMEKVAKKVMKATPMSGDKALKLWNSAVKASAKLLKKMMAKIRSGEPMDTRQQTDLYNQWTNVFDPNLVDTSQVDPSQTMASKRSRREGEGSSRMVQQQSSGDDTPSDEGRPIAPKRKSRKVSRRGGDK